MNAFHARANEIQERYHKTKKTLQTAQEIELLSLEQLEAEAKNFIWTFQVRVRCINKCNVIFH
jgi:two-component sensor histidine kinase